MTRLSLIPPFTSPREGKDDPGSGQGMCRHLNPTQDDRRRNHPECPTSRSSFTSGSPPTTRRSTPTSDPEQAIKLTEQSFGPRLGGFLWLLSCVRGESCVIPIRGGGRFRSCEAAAWTTFAPFATCCVLLPTLAIHPMVAFGPTRANEWDSPRAPPVVGTSKNSLPGDWPAGTGPRIDRVSFACPVFHNAKCGNRLR